MSSTAVPSIESIVLEEEVIKHIAKKIVSGKKLRIVK